FIAAIEVTCRKAQAPDNTIKKDGGDAVSVAEQLGHVKLLCDRTNLQLTGDCVDEILRHLEKEGLTYADLGAWMMELHHSAYRELKRTSIMYVPNEDAKFYEREELFGKEVRNKFPSAVNDIRAAGNCYATDNSTACVMHLMRVLELGLNSLAKQFRV